MKKEGSALILAVLMLSFFTAIALTMFTIARNRNQRSISKIRGSNIDKNLDIGTELAHYELYLSSEYVTKGYLYETTTGIDYRGDNSSYTLATSSQDYSKEINIDGNNVLVPTAGKHYTGIVLNNYDEYFVALWDIDEGNEITTDISSVISSQYVLKQPWIKSENIIDNKIISRDWENNSGEKVKRLWDYSLGEEISVGGYRLIKIEGEDKNNNDLTLPLEGSNLKTSETTEIALTYEKIISINNNNLNYRVTYEEVVEVSTDGSNLKIENYDEGNITIEKIVD